MTLRWVEPGALRLPPTRAEGADPMKLASQLRTFGASTVGMPPMEVTLGADDEMMINDGVTRATRVQRYCDAGTMIAAILIDARPGMVLSDLPRVRDR